MYYHWQVTASVLERHSLDKDEPWVKVTLSIFNDNPALLYVSLPTQTNLPT
jgi:hypothetical protein